MDPGKSSKIRVRVHLEFKIVGVGSFEISLSAVNSLYSGITRNGCRSHVVFLFETERSTDRVSVVSGQTAYDTTARTPIGPVDLNRVLKRFSPTCTRNGEQKTSVDRVKDYPGGVDGIIICA